MANDEDRVRIHGEDIAVLKTRMDSLYSEQQVLWTKLNDMDKSRKADTDRLLEAITGNKMASEILQSKWKMAGAIIVAITAIGSALVGAATLAWKLLTGVGH